MTIDNLLPLTEAARKFGVAEGNLRALVDKGKIRAGKLPSGEIVVSEQDTQAQKPTAKEDLPEFKKHAHLKGTPIWIGEAARKYNLLQQTISKWVKMGIIRRIGEEGYKVLVDEADVAYCAEIYHQRGGQGRWLFNSDGTPYQPKTGPFPLTK